MDATEKQILRAQLLASGVIRYWQWDKSKSELERWLEVMAEELEHLNDPVALLKIRENLLRYGLRVPEVTTPVHVYNPIALQAADAIGDSSDSEVCGRLPKAYSMSPARRPFNHRKTQTLSGAAQLLNPKKLKKLMTLQRTSTGLTLV